MQDIIVIMEEGKFPQPPCPACNMFVPWAALNHRHHTTDLCVQGAEQKIWLLVEE